MDYLNLIHRSLKWKSSSSAAQHRMVNYFCYEAIQVTKLQTNRFLKGAERLKLQAWSPRQNGVEPIGGHFCLDEEEQRLGEADDPPVHDVLRGAVTGLAPGELVTAGAVVVVLDVLEKNGKGEGW